MGGGRKGPPRKKPAANRARQKRQWRWRTFVSGAFALVVLSTGIYLAALHSEISTLLEQRRAALSSSVFSAPHRIRIGDDIHHSQLLDRLTSLSYTAVASAQTPGEYARSASEITIYLRGFRQGARQYASQLVQVRLAGGEIVAVNDATGAPALHAMLEPEAIGRLIPGTPAERVEIRLADQKPYLVDGLLATEDQYFYYHPGINPVRIVKAAVEDLRAGRLASGASTLTQQLARTFMERRERTFERKLRELAVALVLEFRLSKAQILERYINDVSMGAYEGAPIHGMPQAARYFFNKDLGQVTPAEAATLIGMVQAPTMYDPRRYVEACTRRRDVVLAVMKREGVIDDATHASAVATPIKLAKSPGFRRAPYFTDYVISSLNRIPGFDGNLAGLKVFTTLDSEIQADTVEAVTTNLEKLEKGHRQLRRSAESARLQTSAVVLDARTGAIRALVGGRDYSESQFNRAASALRQPGSAFKPIVYLAALDPARAPISPVMTLASLLPNQPMNFNGWTPANYEHSDQARVTVVKAMSESLNIPAAYVGSRLGAKLMVRTAHELGIGQELDAVLPISIGAEETTLLDLTSAYQVFANSGIRSPAYAIESVVDARDREIYRHEDADSRVVDPAVAYLITGALKMVLKSGTGASAGRLGLDFPAAGKTGTTQDYKDAFFVGYTPAIVCGVWLGFDVPQSLGLTGAQAALPAWVQIMQDSAPADPTDFPEPPGIVKASIDPESGGLATPSCAKRVTLPFLVGTAPTDACPMHGDEMLESGATSSHNWGGWKSTAPTAAARGRETKSANVFHKVGKFFGSLFGR